MPFWRIKNRENQQLRNNRIIIFTPDDVSLFIYNLLSPLFPDKDKIIYDPCCGKYSLLKPWKEAGYKVYGTDIKGSFNPDKIVDFLQLEEKTLSPQLIICNPPFNGLYPKSSPEIWLKKIIKLFGKDAPLVFFAKLNLRITHKLQSKRYQEWVNGTYPPISAIVCLPDDIYNTVDNPVLVNSEILIFNIQGLAPHYFLPIKENPDTEDK